MTGGSSSWAGARRCVAVAFLVLTWWAVTAAPAGAQVPGDAVADLQDHDVAFENGALTSSLIAELDELTAKLQDGDGYFKVVVLADPVKSFSDAASYANAVQTELGGKGRVLVFTPDEVGLYSNLDNRDQITAAEQAAANALNNGSSYAAATSDAAAKLSSDVSSLAAAAGTGDSTGGSGAGVFLLILLGLGVAVLAFLWWSSRRMRKGAEQASAAEIGAAETKVRTAVDNVANDVLDLSDRIDSGPPEAKAAFTKGAELFTATQEVLEDADTRPELEAVYPQVVEAGWHMDTARALLDDQPAPAKPELEPLFPRVVAPATAGPVAGTSGRGGAGGGMPAPSSATPRPEPHYRQQSSSPWLTAAAMAAMAVLSQRGMSVPQTRPSMDDGAFGNWSSGLPPSPSSGRGRGGNGGRGGGSRSGSVVVPSSQRRRGMNRR
jgi:hypothetical protein